jgi:hypothetical protein
VSAGAAKTGSSSVQDAETPGLSLGDVRRLAEVLAPLLARLLAPVISGRGSVDAADVSPRLRKEMDPWREEANPSGCSDHIDTTDDGESSWSQQEARRLLRTMKAKRKRGRSSDR